MRRLIERSCQVLFLGLLVFSGIFAQIYPGESWSKVKNPEELGYSSEKLSFAKEKISKADTAAVVIVINGKILYEWGEVERKFYVHSIRKSFLSALFGPYVKEGIIYLDRTLEDIRIDDIHPSLSRIEKTATIRDLLKARSGIYHDAAAETPQMRELKPLRHSHKPGSFWYYNNWDFNALGTIFEILTGKEIFQAFYDDISVPLQMEDFEVSDGSKETISESIHPAYHFKMSARDMARFGLLMLRNGKWGNTQVIPAVWVEESTKAHSDASLFQADGYGYMWWVAVEEHKYKHLWGVELKSGTFSARGYGGHYLIVIPEYDMVFVHRVNTFIEGNFVSPLAVGQLLNRIFVAKNK